MALTQEQLHNLAVGDEIIVHGKCEDICFDGDIRVNSYWTVAGERREQSFLVHSSYVSLPPEKPKYDPCRLFRKGDIVRLKEWNGRCPALPDGWKFDGGLFEVHVDEKFSSSVAITRENSKDIYLAPICFLELVTPVEELEPYNVESHENGECGCFKVMQGKQCVSIYPYGTHETRYYKKSEQAKEAAEAECERLNAEWKKNKTYNQN